MIRRALLFSFLLITSFSLAQVKRPFTFEDMMQLKRIGDFTVSPDGRWVAFSAADVSLAKNTVRPHLWVVPLKGGEERRLTDANGPTESGPQFSPDGKSLLFISARGGNSQIWVQSFDPETGTLTGEPRQVTNISTDADGAVWSPDGKSILFVSSVYPDCTDDACNKARDEEKAKSPVKAQIWTHLFFRHWSTWTDGKFSHLFLVASDCDGAKAGEACAGRDLTPGAYDTPPFQLGGQIDYSFSPDSKEVAYTSNHDAMPAASTNNDVFVLSLTDPDAKPKDLTAANHGSDSNPMYSPDGKWIAIRSQFRAGYESDRFRLQLINRETGAIRNLTEKWDRWVNDMAWAPDSKSLYFTTDNAGDSPIYKLAIDGNGWPEEVVAGANGAPTPTADGKTLVFARVSVEFPTEIYTAPTDYPVCQMAAEKSEQYTMPACALAKATPLTKINEGVLSQVQMQPLEPFWFTGSVNHKVEGFVVKPPNFDANKKYPVKFLIHGGPQGAWGDEWSYRWNPELFASDGYVVIMVNPRGSTGYGQQFIDDVNGDWGGRPYQDLMLGLDYAEKTLPYIDKNRECALGASYGGYMIDWILGHTDRFKCLVSHDGMYDTEAAYGATEELWFPEWEFRGTPWTNREMYRKWDPKLSAANFKTPTLVVHSQHDYRLDVSQGFELFTTLQRLGVPSKMLYFPDESHFVLKPQNSQLWNKTVNGWVDQWTKESKK